MSENQILDAVMEQNIVYHSEMTAVHHNESM